MKFKTEYLNLSCDFGINFINGEYETNNKKEIEYLNSLSFVKQIIEIKPQKTLEGQ